jgi:hypothetical protein
MSPYFFLILGIISLIAGVVSTCTGKALMRFHGWVYRAEEPTLFWQTVGVYYLIAVWFIIYFLYKSHAL